MSEITGVLKKLCGEFDLSLEDQNRFEEMITYLSAKELTSLRRHFKSKKSTPIMKYINAWNAHPDEFYNFDKEYIPALKKINEWEGKLVELHPRVVITYTTAYNDEWDQPSVYLEGTISLKDDTGNIHLTEAGDVLVDVTNDINNFKMKDKTITDPDHVARIALRNLVDSANWPSDELTTLFRSLLDTLE